MQKRKQKSKKFLSLLLTLAMVFSLCSVPAYADASDFAGGSGTADDPYLIATEAQFTKATELGKYYLLINDITATHTYIDEKPQPFCESFSGYFDGGGHTIYNLKAPLFKTIPKNGIKPEIKNLNIVYQGGSDERGTVFSSGQGSGDQITLSNIHVTITGNANCSGLAGDADTRTLKITNCSVVVENGASISDNAVTAVAGGLTRHIKDFTNISDSFVYIKEGGRIVATNTKGDTSVGYACAGGISGALSGKVYAREASVTNCYVINEGTISARVKEDGEYVAAGAGVMFGADHESTTLTIKNIYAYNTGNVSFAKSDSTALDGHVGFLVGHISSNAGKNGSSNIVMSGLTTYDSTPLTVVGTKDSTWDLDTNGRTIVSDAADMANEENYSTFSLNTGSSWLRNSSVSPAYGTANLSGVPYLKMEETAELETYFVEANLKRDDDVTTELKNKYSSYNLTSIAGVITESDYSFTDGKLTINNSYIQTLSEGTLRTLTLTFDKGLPVNFYIYAVKMPILTLQQATGGSATFEDGSTKAIDAVANDEVKVIAAPAEGYVLKGWKVGGTEQPDSAKEEWTYTVPGGITGDITITPVFEETNNYVAFTLKDKLNGEADMTGAVVTITKREDSSVAAQWTWKNGITYNKPLQAGEYQYKVEKEGYFTETKDFTVDYSSGNHGSIAMEIGKYYVGPYNDIEQKLTPSGSGNDIYTVSYEINKVRAVSGQLTVTLPPGVKLMNGENPAVNGDVNVTAGADIKVGSSTLNGDQLIITWAVDTGVTPHYVDTLDGPKTILSFNVKPTGKKTIEATCNVADNNPNGADTDTKPLTVDVGVDILKYTVTFNANGHGTAPAAQSGIAYEGKATEPTAPTAAGYTFGGWYKEAGCTTAWNFETDKVTADTTLYAKWTANTYTVTFNANGHGTAPAAQSGIAYEGKASAPTAPTAAGYTFGGWYKEVGCTTAWDFETDKVTADTTLYAKWTANSTSGGGGGIYIPPVQKPVVDNNDNAKTELSSDGTKLSIKAEEGYKVVDVIVNGVSKGAVDTLTGLKTGDKIVVVTEKIETEPTIEEVKAELGTSSLVARSQAVTLKNGKKAIKITWYDQNGNEVKYDGVEIYRSTKRNTGYGKKPIYVSKSGVYYNTSIKLGTKYYYRVRGFREIDGQKYYTNWSLKAFRAW